MTKERIWHGKQILLTKEFAETVRVVGGALTEKGISYALVGGLATAYHANPVVTVDVDFLVDDDRSRIESAVRGLGRLFPLRFMGRTQGLPRAGVRLVMSDVSSEVDLISASDDLFLMSTVESAKTVKIGEVLCPVITAENLIVMKTLVGRDKDLEDVFEIRKVLGDKLDETYIEKTLSRLE